MKIIGKIGNHTLFLYESDGKPALYKRFATQEVLRFGDPVMKIGWRRCYLTKIQPFYGIAGVLSLSIDSAAISERVEIDDAIYFVYKCAIYCREGEVTKALTSKTIKDESLILRLEEAYQQELAKIASSPQ